MESNLLYSAWIILFGISQLHRVSAVIDYLDRSCLLGGGTYTEGSVYQQNLNIVLSDLSTQSTTRLFYNSTAGEASNKIYGLYQCRGDVGQEVCAECIQDATNMIIYECPYNGEAAIWYEQCMLRYANRSIFSSFETYPRTQRWSSLNVSDYDALAPVLASTLNGVVNEASKKSSRGYFATKESNWTRMDKVYCLAQCTSDLTEFHCKKCLTLCRSVMINVFNTSVRVAVYLPSCQLRYDTGEKFYLATHTPSTTSVSGATSNKSHRDTRLKKPVIAGIAVAAAVGVILVVASIWFFLFPNKSKQSSTPKSISQLPPPPPLEELDDDALGGVEFVQYDFATLKAATSDFSTDTMLGKGGFGVVYLGTLNSGLQVAIKRLSDNSGQGAREFMTEAQIVAKLQHRNLVNILGFCSEGNEKLLVYEFLPNKSLDYFLFDPTKRSYLDWETRYKIIMGVVGGIRYLHEDSRLTIIHRDLKPNNILLDIDMSPKIADFGIARLFQRQQELANTSRVIGTRGYMAPEFILRGEYSEKYDVYSFGVIILELVTGQKNTIHYQREDLPMLAWRLWNMDRSFELLDPTLYENCSKNEVMRCIQIGLLCVQQNAVDRPTMAAVVLMLTGSIALPAPTTPAMYPHNFNVPTLSNDDERQSESATKYTDHTDFEQDLYAL